MNAPKTILVTGCAGFIGSNFVQGYKKQFPESKIIGIDSLETGFAKLVEPTITFYKGTFCDEQLVEKIFKTHQPEFVFHFGALPRVKFSIDFPIASTNANIMGTVTLLTKAAAHKTKRFIYSSSSSVYGGAKKLPTSEADNQPNPISPYAFQKYAGEAFSKMFSQYHGLDTVVLRYFNVFGPNQFIKNSGYVTAISSWLDSLFLHPENQPVLYGDGSQSRDFTYVDNVVQANILAMQSPKQFNGEAFNIAAGQRTSLLEVQKLIEKHAGKKLNFIKQPNRVGDVQHTHADISKAKAWFGYEPLVNFEEGLKKTIAWYQSQTRT